MLNVGPKVFINLSEILAFWPNFLDKKAILLNVCFCRNWFPLSVVHYCIQGLLHLVSGFDTDVDLGLSLSAALRSLNMIPRRYRTMAGLRNWSIWLR